MSARKRNQINSENEGRVNMSEVIGKKPPIIDISSLIENPPKRFMLSFLLIAWLTILMDGFDFAVLTYAAPSLIKTMSIAPKVFGMVFSASTFGMMFGSVLFGIIGDKYGRKKSLMISIAWFSLATLSTVLATSLESLLALRFIAGIGIGGVPPAVIVLVSEYAPIRSKFKWVIVAYTGHSFGAALIGFVAARLLPIYGWESLFIVGGIVPILVAIGVHYLLPESMRFLMLKQNYSAMAKIATALKPDLQVLPDTQFIMTNKNKEENQSDKPQQKFSYKTLFSGKLGFATPLIWLFFIANATALYFLISWFPVVFMNSGFSPAQASSTTALFSVGSMVGGVFVGCMLDKYDLRIATIFPALGTIAVAILGFVSGAPLIVLVFMIGFFVVGTQYVLNGWTPLFYPTSCRTRATGVAIALAKFGSIAGPLIGGVLLNMHMPMKELFYIVAIPMFAGTLFCLALTQLYEKHFKVSDQSSTAAKM